MYVNEQAVKEILEKVKPAKLVAATNRKTGSMWLFIFWRK